MSLIEKLKLGASSLVEGLKSVGSKIVSRTCDIAHEVCDAVSSVLTKMRDKWEEKAEEHKRQAEEKGKKAEVIDVYIGSTKYIMPKADEKMARGLECYLTETFPQGITKAATTMSDEQKMETIQSVFNACSDIMGLQHKPELQLIQTEAPVCGAYNPNNNVLELNASLIFATSNPELFREQVFTVLHELKHARQFEAVLSDYDFGYTKEELQAFADNMETYFYPDESQEAYSKQPLERDTFGLEEYLKERIN